MSGNDQNQQPTTVDPALLATIQQVVQASMQAMMQQGFRPAEPAASRSGKLRAEDLGYFDPDYESERNESIVNAGRHIYYRDMYVWIDHIKDLVKTYGDNKVRLLII